MKYFLTILLIISVSFAGVRLFHPEKYVMALFSKSQKQENTVTPPEENFSYSEHFERGNSYLKQGFVELARDEYIKAINKNSKEAIAYVQLAKAQTLLKNYKGAIENLVNAAHIENGPEIQIALAENQIHLKEFQEAQKILKRFENSFQESDYLLDTLNIVLTQNIEPSYNVRHTDTYKKAQVLKKAFDDFKLYKGAQQLYLKTLISKALLDNKDYELSAYLLEKVLQERSDYRDAWIMLGYATMNMEDYLGAKNAFSKAYDLDPTKAETQFFLAIALEELGEKQQALEFYQLAYKNHYEPKIHVLQKVADLSLEFGYYQESFALYEELLKTQHENANSFVRPISIAISRLSNLEKAQELAEWAQKAYPQEAQSYNLLAWVSIEKEDYKNAQKHLNQAFQIDPKFAAAHYNQGLLYEKLEENEKALSEFERAYQRDKDGPIGNLAAEAYNRLLAR